MATKIPTNEAAFTTEEIAAATGGTARGAAAGRGLTTDSRAVMPGGIFVALRGENHDGHAFVPKAVAAGAAIVVVQRGADAAGAAAVVEVDDTLVAWGDLARAHLARWRQPGCKVIAITGSAGKTTTKELTAALVGAVGGVHFTAGNLNNRIGVPAVVFGLRPEHRFAVLEMGMSLPGELDAIVSFARPDVSVVVNVGVAHAENLGGGREGVMREKGAVYRGLGPEGIAIVNADDDFVLRAAVEAGVRTQRTFGAAGEYAIAARGERLRLRAAGRELEVRLPIPGEAAATDLCAAIAAQEAATGVQLSAERITEALASLTVPGRGDLQRLPDDVLLLDDTYNANPASMRAALATLAEVAGSRRKIAVLGEMKELGDIGRSEHLLLGDAIVDAGVTLVIGCGGLINLALFRAAKRGIAVVSATSTETAAKEAKARVRPGDAVLVKGSRGVGAERVVAVLTGA